MPPDARRTRRADALDRHRGQRIQQGGDQAELPVHVEHRGHQPDHGHAVAERVHRPDHRLADGDGVGGEAGGELSRRFPLDAGDVCLHQMAEHPPLQVADHDQHQVLHRQRLAVLRRRLRRGDQHHQRRHLVEDARIVGREHVERALDHQRVERGQGCHQHRQHQHRQKPGAVLAHLVAPQPAQERRAGGAAPAPGTQRPCPGGTGTRRPSPRPEDGRRRGRARRRRCRTGRGGHGAGFNSRHPEPQTGVPPHPAPDDAGTATAAADGRGRRWRGARSDRGTPPVRNLSRA